VLLDACSCCSSRAMLDALQPHQLLASACACGVLGVWAAWGSGLDAPVVLTVPAAVFCPPLWCTCPACVHVGLYAAGAYGMLCVHANLACVCPCCSCAQLSALEQVWARPAGLCRLVCQELCPRKGSKPQCSGTACSCNLHSFVHGTACSCNQHSFIPRSQAP
jgi:hypothetical protein